MDHPTSPQIFACRKFESVSKLLQTGDSSQVNIYEDRNIFGGLLMDFGARYPKPALKKTVPLLVIRILRMEFEKIQASE